MDKVDISTWKGKVWDRRYSNYVKSVPKYSPFEVMFFVNRCNHCKGDNRGVCRNWCVTNYCMLIHRYCPVSVFNGNFIERIDPNVSDVQATEVGRIGPKPARVKYYFPSPQELARINKKREFLPAYAIRITPNGFRVRRSLSRLSGTRAK